MRFLIQIPQLIFAGAEKVLISFANDLVSRGHEVEILESYDRGYLKPQFDSRVAFHCICSNEYTDKYYASLTDIKAEKKAIKKIIKIGKLTFSKVVGYRRFAERLAAKHYADKYFDVAINYLEIESPSFLLESIHAKCFIQWYHTDVKNVDNPQNTDRMITCYKKMDAIVCVSEVAKKNFVERYPQLEEKTHAIYNFFDSKTILEKSEESFSFCTAKSGMPVLLSVGRMTQPKQYLRFLKVLKRLKNEGIEFQWHVIGDGNERSRIERKILEYDLEGWVFLEGVCDNPYKYMRNCDLFVLPSGWEGFPTVTVEAKVLNCAVLATDVSGIREQLEHGKTGWIVSNNEESIYEGLKYLLLHDAERERLRDNTGIEKIIDNQIKYDAIMNLIAEKRV